MNARITVVGSFAAGLTMQVARLPVNGETVLGSGYRTDHGGKGSNQAVGCARLGAAVRLVASIGRDAFGEMALHLYRREGVETTWVRPARDAPTGVGFILVEAESGENCIVLDPGANNLLTAGAVEAAEGAFETAQVVLTQLEIPAEAAAAALRLGHASGAITILNPAPARPLPPSVLEQADVLTPNTTEAKALLGREPNADVPAADLARELVARGAKQVVVTLGRAGAVLVAGGVEVRVPAIKVPVVDSTGAGDAFNAGLAVALANGSDLESAVRFAVVTGGLAVTKAGVIPALPSRAEVRACLKANGLPAPGWLA